MLRIGNLRVHVVGLAFYGIVIAAIVVGAVAGAVLALTLLAAGGGTGIAARDAVSRRGRSLGRPLYDEEPDRRRE